MLLKNVGVEKPILLAPMAGGPNTPALAAAVAKAGGLAPVAAGYMTPDQITQAIREVRAVTDGPLNVNLFAGGYATAVNTDPAPMMALMSAVHTELGLPAPVLPALAANPFAEQLEAVLEARPDVFSFTFGIPDRQSLERIRARGIMILGTATTVAEARMLADAGIDAIVAQGSEAGAHRGTFAAVFEASMVPTLELVRGIAAFAPVIASGGIMDAADVQLMLANGAFAVQMGTAFLTCTESGASDSWKAALLNAKTDTTVITRAFSGRHARGLRNAFIEKAAEDTILPFPVQNTLTRAMRAAAAKQGDPGYQSLWAGQGVTRCRVMGAGELMESLFLKKLSLALLLLAAQVDARVIVVSFDGMGYHSLAEVPALQSLLKQSAHASVTAHFPSTTSNTHAALWTGAWGDVNGITANSMPLAPRDQHTAFERITGFSSIGLRAEPIWSAASRQGVKTVAQEATQSFPFKDSSGPLTILNGYQVKQLAPETFLRRKNVKDEACAAGADPASRCFTWIAGPVAIHAALHGNTIMVSTGSEWVETWADAVENDPPVGRELARHFSPALYLATIPAVVYFRLFEASPDGSDFLLYQSPLREQSLSDHGKPATAALQQLLHEAGGFLPNGPDHSITEEPFNLGVPAWKGGDGTAELRYLEVAELVVRQNIRQAEWLLKHYQPQLFIGYLPYPDEIEHTFLGLSVNDARYAGFRRTGYELVNRAVEAYIKMRQPADDLLLVSDHGMTPSFNKVRVNAALRDAGLLAIDAAGNVDPARTQVIHMTDCLLINTEDWKGGIVPLAERGAVLRKAEAAISEMKDPETGKPIVSRILDSPQDRLRFGFGGPNGWDLCFDYLPGYDGVAGASDPVVSPMIPPKGEHGYLPTRLEMQAMLIAVGPGLPPGKEWRGIRSIDVAPLIARLLRIAPPKDARGTSPLR